MPLIPGSVTINPGTGAATGAGLAREYYDALIAAFGLAPASVPQNVPGAQEQVAVIANTIAQVTVAHFIANGLVTTPAGVTVATTGTAAAQTGATTAPGLGTIS
jgi:hypothetical protein